MKSNLPNSEQMNEMILNISSVLPTDQWGPEHHLRMVSLLNHYRHDWMNEIQLVFGYVKLKKYDKLQDLMDKIKTKVQTESYISKLGIPELMVYILSFQTEVKDLLLEVEMEQEIRINELPLDAVGVSRLMMSLMEVFKGNALSHQEGDHTLRVRLDIEAERFLADFCYEGELSPSEINPLIQQLIQQSNAVVKWEVNQIEDYQAVIRIAVPLNT